MYSTSLLNKAPRENNTLVIKATFMDIENE